MRTKPVIVLSVIVVAAVASAFAAGNRRLNYLYHPDLAAPGVYAPTVNAVNCQILEQEGCKIAIPQQSGLKQLYTTRPSDGVTVPVNKES